MNLAACIISIGNELTEGRTLNTNAHQLAQQLEKQGIPVTRMLTLQDDPISIQSTLQTLFTNTKDREAILIVTGGLGGTSDDQTVSSLAQTFKRNLVTDAAHLKRLKKLKQLRNLPDRFLKQAKIPSGFTATANPWGTAPFLYELKSRPHQAIFLLPGVPTECLSLCEQKVIPLIKKHFISKNHQPGTVQTVLKAIGTSETTVEEIISNLGFSDLRFAYLPLLGELELIIKDSHTSQPLKTRKARLQAARRKIIRALPSTAFCYAGATPLIHKLHQQFIKKQWKLGIAESCTGGLLASAFVNIPNASKYLALGVVSYSNDAKIHKLNVPAPTLQQHGAVSAETAEAMATGIAKNQPPALALDLSISTTGVAGPGGGTRHKPVGTVYISFHLPKLHQTHSERLQLKGTREQIRMQTVQRTLVKLALFLKNNTDFF